MDCMETALLTVQHGTYLQPIAANASVQPGFRETMCEGSAKASDIKTGQNTCQCLYGLVHPRWQDDFNTLLHSGRIAISPPPPHLEPAHGLHHFQLVHTGQVEQLLRSGAARPPA